MTDKTAILNSIKEAYGIEKNSQFAKFLGVKPQTISSWYTRNTFDADLIYAKCEGLDANFLFNGSGDVLLRKSDTEQLHNANEIFKLRTDTSKDIQVIPLYNLEATAGLVDLFQNQEDNTPVDTIRIPNLPKCDGAIYVKGDSMYPLLKSGDIVAYKQINDFSSEIFWGEMYLIAADIAGSEFVTIKYIKKSEKGEEYIKLVSQNAHHQDKDIHLNKVRAMALIKASIRINSIG